MDVSFVNEDTAVRSRFFIFVMQEPSRWHCYAGRNALAGYLIFVADGTPFAFIKRGSLDVEVFEALWKGRAVDEL